MPLFLLPEFPTTTVGATIFRKVKAVEGVRGGVAALRRTSGPEDLRRDCEKSGVPARYTWLRSMSSAGCGSRYVCSRRYGWSNRSSATTADALYTITTLVHTSSSVAVKSNLSDLSFRAILRDSRGRQRFGWAEAPGIICWQHAGAESFQSGASRRDGRPGRP